MNCRIFGVLGLFMASLALYGCGQGAGDAAGLNGAITVSASASGSFITATATYTNPTKTDLIGTPIWFSYQVAGTTYSLGTVHTNNSGTVSVVFTPAAFNANQTFLVTAGTGNLQNFATVNMSGRSLSLAPPAVAPVFTNVSSTSTVDIPIPIQLTFATFKDPFASDLSGLVLDITETLESTLDNASTIDLLNSTTTTNVLGIAPFPGATAHMTVPPKGGSNTLSVTWIVKDNAAGGTGLSATGVTTIVLSH